MDTIPASHDLVYCSIQSTKLGLALELRGCLLPVRGQILAVTTPTIDRTQSDYHSTCKKYLITMRYLYKTLSIFYLGAFTIRVHASHLNDKALCYTRHTNVPGSEELNQPHVITVEDQVLKVAIGQRDYFITSGPARSTRPPTTGSTR